MTGDMFPTWLMTSLISCTRFHQDLADEIASARGRAGQEGTLITLGGGDFMITSREAVDARNQVGILFHFKRVLSRRDQLNCLMTHSSLTPFQAEHPS